MIYMKNYLKMMSQNISSYLRSYYILVDTKLSESAYQKAAFHDIMFQSMSQKLF